MSVFVCVFIVCVCVYMCDCARVCVCVCVCVCVRWCGGLWGGCVCVCVCVCVWSQFSLGGEVFSEMLPLVMAAGMDKYMKRRNGVCVCVCVCVCLCLCLGGVV